MGCSVVLHVVGVCRGAGACETWHVVSVGMLHGWALCGTSHAVGVLTYFCYSVRVGCCVARHMKVNMMQVLGMLRVWVCFGGRHAVGLSILGG